MARCRACDLINYTATKTTIAEGARMNRFLATLILCGLSSAAFAAHSHASHGFKLTSTAFTAHGTLADEQVFNSFGCSGKNLSPALHWSGAPQGTQSFALMVYDPDAPTGSGWWHWVVYNIPASATDLSSGAGATDGTLLPAGALQGRTDFGTTGYGGPCPPAGDKPHHYIFTLYALKVAKLDVPADASPALIGFYAHANKLAAAKITARFGR
jgi:Raf kinase inhibitor-like YbhB/YbcL family protein